MDVREPYFLFFFFFFNDTATTEIYTLSLHDALPIFDGGDQRATSAVIVVHHLEIPGNALTGRSEEHTSELQSQSNLVCRLLLEKKKKITDSKLHHIQSRLEQHTPQLHTHYSSIYRLV